MKTNILTFILIILGFASCSLLDVDIPDNLVKDDYWKTKDQVKASLAGVYTSLNSHISRFYYWGDMRSEIYQDGVKDLTNNKQFIRQDIFTNNSLLSWSTMYQSINWTNSFIKNARSTMLEDPTITEVEMLAWESEARAIRALYYFYLVRTFKEVPLVVEPFESDDQQIYYGLSSEQEVLDTIISDLEFALTGAYESYSNPNENYGKITKKAVRAILADVKLWKKDYEGALALCMELDKEYSNKLINPEAWFTIFSQGNSQESIFEYQYINAIGVSSPLYSLFFNNSENVLRANWTYIHNKMLTRFPSESEDYVYSDTIRSVTVFPLTGEVLKFIASDPYALPVQYRGVDNRDVNFIFYRYKEILLMKAEALAMLRRYNEAVATINILRQATNLPIIHNIADYGHEQAFFEALLDERIGELAFEGKHWFTQVRMARNTGYSDLVIGRIVDATRESLSTVSIQTIRARLTNPESWFLPYLKTEVDNNPLIAQKKYYEGK